MKGARTCKLDFCEHCVIGKKTNMKFSIATHCTEGILDYIHTDIWGPTKTVSIGGNYYFMSFIYDYSKRYWVYTMKHKGNILELFVEWKSNMEINTRRKIKVLRSDNGREYISDFFYVAMRA